MIRTGARALAAILLSTLLSAMTFAADFPTRAITMITPFPAGGANDTLARLLAEHMSETLGEDLSTRQDNFRSIDDIVAAAQARPLSLSIASFGTGTSSHLAAEYFQRLADIQLLHVPFKGSNYALPQLISGSVDLFFDMIATGMPQADAGKLNVHAITSSQRMLSLPDLPTMAESGFPGFEMTAWFTLVAPTGTSIDITGKLALALDTALRDEPMRQHMLRMGIEPAEGTPRALTRQIEKEMPIIQSLVELADITVQ